MTFFELTETYLDKAANELETLMNGSGARLQIFRGAMPENCADADSGEMLDDLTLQHDWLSASTPITISWPSHWPTDVFHFRVKDSTGTKCHIQGYITGGYSDDIVIIYGKDTSTVTFSFSYSNA